MVENRRMCRVLDADPELGEGLSPEQFRDAHQRAVAELLTVEPGEWKPPARDVASNGSPTGDLGLLVIDGLLLRGVGFSRTICAELIGQGDLLRPWDEDRRHSTSPLRIRWRVLRPTRLAVLDRRFAAVACSWPELVEVTLSRSVRRSQRLAFHLALSNLKRIDVRLHILLWHLADRWGRVGVEGISLQLPLTHEMLAHLVAAKRPSVTTALGQLTTRGVLSRRRDGTWVLHGDPPVEIEDIAELGDGEEDGEGAPLAGGANG